MIKTGTISFRSDTEIDFMINELIRYHKSSSKGIEYNQTDVIRSAIYWYYDDCKNDNEFDWKENYSKNKSLTNSS